MGFRKGQLVTKNPPDRVGMFDENIFSHGGKIEHPRADLIFFLTNVIAVSLSMKHVIRQKLAKVADSAKIIDFLSL